MERKEAKQKEENKKFKEFVLLNLQRGANKKRFGDSTSGSK
jgi:hypothetical protein